MRNLFRSKIVIGVVVVLVLGIGYFIFFGHHGTSYQFITVTEGPITETVSVTGNTTPMQSVSLGFQGAGTISHVYHNLGDNVKAGDVITSLDTADLSAALAQAEAGLDTAKANLASLEDGTRPEQLSLDQSAVTNAQTALLNAMQNGYVAAQDGINNKIIPFFGTTSTIQEPLILDSKYYNLMAPMSQVLSNWNSEVNAITPTTPTDPQKLVTDVDGYLSSLISSVDSVSSDLGQQASTTVIPLATIQSLLAQITAVRLTLTSTKTTIDNANAAFVTAEGTLALAKAGSTANEIDAAQAGVEQAQAGVTSAQANLENGEIIAPISGVRLAADMESAAMARCTTRKFVHQ